MARPIARHERARQAERISRRNIDYRGGEEDKGERKGHSQGPKPGSHQPARHKPGK